MSIPDVSILGVTLTVIGALLISGCVMSYNKRKCNGNHDAIDDSISYYWAAIVFLILICLFGAYCAKMEDMSIPPRLNEDRSRIELNIPDGRTGLSTIASLPVEHSFDVPNLDTALELLERQTGLRVNKRAPYYNQDLFLGLEDGRVLAYAQKDGIFGFAVLDGENPAASGTSKESRRITASTANPLILADDDEPRDCATRGDGYDYSLKPEVAKALESLVGGTVTGGGPDWVTWVDDDNTVHRTEYVCTLWIIGISGDISNG